MPSKRKYGHKFLWNLGTLSVLSIFFGVFICFYIATIWLKINRLTPEEAGSDCLFFWMFVILLFAVVLCMLFSAWWKKWALSVVKEEERWELELKIADTDNSYFMESWKEMSTKNKIIAAIIVSGLYWGAVYMDAQRNQKYLQRIAHPAYTAAEILSVKKEVKNKSVYFMAHFKYTIDSVDFLEDWTVSNGYWANVEEKNGFAILAGDRFKLQYLATDPTNQRLDFQEPFEETRSRYLQETKLKTRVLFANSEICDCVVEGVFSTFGLTGIGILNNFDKGYWENDSFNKYRFNTLIISKKYTEILQNCRQKNR